MITVADLEQRVAEGQKIGMTKVNIVHPGNDNEGIWACFVSEKDKEVVDRNTFGDKVEVYLMNHALVSGPTWGAKLTVKTQGENRPVISVEELIEQMQNQEYPDLT